MRREPLWMRSRSNLRLRQPATILAGTTIISERARWPSRLTSRSAIASLQRAKLVSIAENLALAARAAAGADATVVVEALNSYDSPRAALVSSRRALEVISLVRAQAGVANVAFLADLYHLGKMGEDLPGTLAREAPSIAHIQIADVPGRHQPGRLNDKFRIDGSSGRTEDRWRR